jgi:radical SAM superfamily enzyme YgiQ (UPF0313 family)
MIVDLVTCKRQGFREVFDDSGSFPDGKWLWDFCIKKRQSTVEDRPFSCNMRIDAECDFRDMKYAGFRMLLYGVESTNQYTLDRLRKGVKVDKILPTLRKASEAGLEPHIAVMFGYPWSSKNEEMETLKFVHKCLRKGYAKTAQASLYCVDGVESIDRGLVKRIYEAGYYPDFWINKLKDLKRWEDIIYLIRGIKEGLK